MSIPPKYTFQKYLNLILINEGGTSTVWRARHTESNRTIALKILRDDLIKDNDIRRAFYREGTLMLGFDHDYVMQVTTILSGKNPALVMPFFPSDNLKVRYVKQPEVVRKHKLKIAHQTARGLHYVHSQKVIHKDMKPENLLVSEKGDVKIIDFSLAEQRKWYSGIVGILGKSKIQGTPSYLSPEQIKREALEYSTDTYSFGVTLYELFTGRLPFTGNSMDDILSKHLKATPREPAQVLPGLDKSLSDLIMKMLAKNAADRPQNLVEVADIIGKVKEVPQGATVDG